MMENDGQQLHFHLRQAKPEDAEQIARVWQNSIRVLCTPSYGEDVTVPWAKSRTAQMVSQLISCEEFFMVAEAAGVIAGFFSATFSLGTFALYVDPAFTRKGVGTRLFRCYTRIARECGMLRLSFHASLNARSFYEACGCHVVGGMIQEPRPAWLMEIDNSH